MKYKIFTLLIIATSLLTSCSSETVHYVNIETDFGTMKAELYNSTPKHRDNFLKLAREGFYDDLLFHRIIQGFMVQGGDPESKGAAEGVRLGTGGPGYLIDAEIGAPHFKGALAAARTGGASNPEKKSSGSQFYVVHGSKQTDQSLDGIQSMKNITYNESQREKYKSIGGTPSLDQDYTVFGELVEGFDVLDKIAAVQKDGSDRPLKDVKMKVTVSN